MEDKKMRSIRPIHSLCPMIETVEIKISRKNTSAQHALEANLACEKNAMS
jgi:hypothetical protein